MAKVELRDCPKRVGRACSVALRSTETVVFDPFRPPYASQIHAQSISRTPFGQSLSNKRSVSKFPATSGKGNYVLPTSRRSRFVLISFGSEEIRPSGLPHLQPNQYDRAPKVPQSESPQASPSLRANLNSPTLHAQIADTQFSSTLIT